MNMNEAVDIMLGHVEAARPVDTVAIYPDISAEMPTGTKWIRGSVLHGGGRQASLANALGKRKFQKTGILEIQCFAAVGDGLVAARDLADVFVKYLETITNSPVWYRNIRAMEIGKSGSSEQVNVLAEFEYTDIQ